MGTRGSFGVIVGEQEKISYNHYDSYPSGKGVEILRWLRSVMEADGLDEVVRLASECKVVSHDVKPKPKDVKALAEFTNLGVSEQSTKDWYCLTHRTQGSLELMLKSGYMLDGHEFPLDSLFCEWGYILDLDRGTFDVYEGFQKDLPSAGRWAGRPTAAEDLENFKEHLLWCHRNEREPFKEEVSEYKAVALVGSWPLAKLPTDTEFLRLEAVREEV